MNKKIALLALLGTLYLAPASFGQFFYLVEKQQVFDQTGNSTVSPDASQPFKFNANIGSSGGGNSETSNNPAPPNSITVPGNATPMDLSAPTQSDSEWKLKQGFTSQAAMDAAFPNGNYTFTTAGNSGVANLAGDLYPNSPIASFNNVVGSWSGNTFNIFSGQQLVINTNSIAGFVSGNYRVGIDASPQGGFGNITPSDIQFDSGPNFDLSNGNITIPGNLLQAGETWDVKIDFNAFSSFNGTVIPNGSLVGLYTSETSFQVTAIPEPAETILLAGCLALGLACWRRRRVVSA